MENEDKYRRALEGAVCEIDHDRHNAPYLYDEDHLELLEEYQNALDHVLEIIERHKKLNGIGAINMKEDNVIQTANVCNLNRRIYPTNIIEDAVNAKIIGNCKLVNSDTMEEKEDEGNNRVEE